MREIMKRIALLLQNNDIISPDKTEICAYGLELMISTIGEIIIILLFSIFSGVLSETLLFFIAFIPLRIYAGGYHADNRLRCFLILIMVYIIFVIVINVIPNEWYRTFNIWAPIVNIICVFMLAPISHQNRKQTTKEIHIFRKISIIISFAEFIILIAGVIISDKSKLSFAFALGIFTNICSMLSAEIKTKIKGGN